LKNIQNTVKYKSIELFILFFVLPVFLATPFQVYIKLPFVIAGVLYVALLLVQAKQWSVPKVKSIILKTYWMRLLIISTFILVLGVILLQIYDPSQLFKVPKSKPLLWVVILFVYSFISVIPQELIYRKFFYMRYEDLFSSKKLFLFMNVLCFSLCHLFLKNFWVIVITLIGGVFFTYTYEKTRSIKWVSIEHAIYGNLVFTVGLGTMLAFPG